MAHEPTTHPQAGPRPPRLDTHVGELRRKLEADPAAPRHILTVRKAGYRLAIDPE